MKLKVHAVEAFHMGIPSNLLLHIAIAHTHARTHVSMHTHTKENKNQGCHVAFLNVGASKFTILQFFMKTGIKTEVIFYAYKHF